jgi:hypothetical protein
MWWKILIVALFVYFVGKSFFLAENLKYGVPPDEMYHVQVSELFKKASGTLISPDPHYAKHGAYADSPPLYHYLMGLALHLKPDWQATHTWLRYFSLLFTLVYLAVFLVLALEVLQEKLAVLMAFGIQANLLMFTFISASANYDSLTNLFAILVAWKFITFYKHRQSVDLMLYLLFCSLGSLTKLSFLPIPVLFTPLLLFLTRKSLLSWITAGVRFPSNKIIASATLVACISCAGFYFNHILKYQKIMPTCTDHFTHEQCLKSGPYARDFRRAEAAGEFTPMDFSDYIKHWSRDMGRKMIGVLAHKSFFHSKEAHIYFRNVIYLGLLFFLITCGLERRKVEPIPFQMALMSLFYAIFLMLYVCYRGYIATGHFQSGVQGRYLFPVIGLGILSFSYYVTHLAPAKYYIKPVLTIYVVGLFVWYEFPTFIKYAAKLGFFAPV